MKFLFVPFAPSLGHLTRCLALAEVLSSRKHECLFAIGPEKQAMIENAGFQTRIVPEVNHTIFRKLDDKGLKWLTSEYFIQNLQAELAIIRDFGPDKVFFDHRFTTALAARISETTSVGIMHGNLPYLALEPEKSARELVTPEFLRGLKPNIVRKVFPWGYQLAMRSMVNPIRPVLKKYGINNVQSPFELLFGGSNLIASIPEICPANLTARFHIGGPLLWSGWEENNGFFDTLDSRPIIYVTMGSTVDAQTTVLKLIRAMEGLPYQVIVSGGNLNIAAVQIPSNIRIYPMVPGQAIAKRSALVIFHGGHETLMQVLAVGKPSMIIPSNPDQILVAKQVQRIGAGRYLKNPRSFAPVDFNPLKNVSITQIRNEIETVLNDETCQIKCAELKKVIAGYIDSKPYLGWIEKH